MRKISKFLWLLLAGVTLTLRGTAAFADILQVPGLYRTIQEAIREAVTGDTIIVGPGHYQLPYGNIVISKEILTIKSAKGPAQTIITGKPDQPVISIMDNSKAVVEGFTITNETDLDYTILKGGGFYCAPSSRPTIKGNIIVGNRAVFGGAIYCAERSSPKIVDNIIEKNQALTSGGGTCSYRAAPEIIRNRFIDNEAGNSGGAVFSNRDRALVVNNVMWKNRARFGGAVASDRSGTAVINNTIIENSASYGGGIMVDGGPFRMANLILWKNGGDLYYKGFSPFSRPAYSNISDGDFKGTNGNISADPLFTDAQKGDFTLRDDSPCINSGNPEPVYFDPDGSKSDIGAYGGPQAHMENKKHDERKK